MNSISSMTEQLALYKPDMAANRSTRRRSAVTLLIREHTGRGVEILMIERSERQGDPWSGHMAFPGGRIDESDAHSFAAAKRECHEEIGLDVDCHGRYLGRLSDLSKHLRSGSSAMLVTASTSSGSEGAPSTATNRLSRHITPT